MKRVCFIAVLFFSVLGHLSAQNNPFPEPDYSRPKLFADWPDSIPVPMTELDKIFEGPAGEPLDLLAASTTDYAGEKMSQTSMNDGNTITVILHSTNRPGSNFTLTRSVHTDGSESFRGSILSFHSIDCYQLEAIGSKYFLVKKNFYQVISE